MKLDRKSNRGYEFSKLSASPSKELLFKALQYLESTLEIVWRPNSEVIIPIFISLYPTPKKHITRKKLNSLQKWITENQDIRKTTYIANLDWASHWVNTVDDQDFLGTMLAPCPQRNKLKERNTSYLRVVTCLVIKAF